MIRIGLLRVVCARLVTGAHIIETTERLNARRERGLPAAGFSAYSQLEADSAGSRQNSSMCIPYRLGGLFRRDASILHYLCPFRHFRLDEVGELQGRCRRNVESLILQTLLRVGHVQCSEQVSI